MAKHQIVLWRAGERLGRVGGKNVLPDERVRILESEPGSARVVTEVIDDDPPDALCLQLANDLPLALVGFTLEYVSVADGGPSIEQHVEHGPAWHDQDTVLRREARRQLVGC